MVMSNDIQSHVPAVECIPLPYVYLPLPWIDKGPYRDTPNLGPKGGPTVHMHRGKIEYNGRCILLLK